jgi:serine O-acetyltransferase
MTADDRHIDGPERMRQIRAAHPGLREALIADAQVTAAHRFERHEFRSGIDAALQILRLMLVTDAFLAQALYRVKARLQAIGVPLLPRLCHHLAIASGQVSIGDPVLVHPGVYLIHGQVVIDGFTEVHSGAVIGPFVTLGLRAGDLKGPWIGPGVTLGTGVKVLGRVEIGAGARVGANAVVVEDVGESVTVVGVPARPVPGGDAPAG